MGTNDWLLERLSGGVGALWVIRRSPAELGRHGGPDSHFSSLADARES
jgi:hypothetical protein